MQIIINSKIIILRNVSSTNCINSHSHWGVEMCLLGFYTIFSPNSSPQDDLKVKYDTVVAENNQLLKNIERMSELCLQVAEANKRIKELEQQLALDQVQVLANVIYKERCYNCSIERGEGTHSSSETCIIYQVQVLLACNNKHIISTLLVLHLWGALVV